MTPLAARLPFDQGLALEPAPPPAPRFWRLARETSRRAWYMVRDTLPPRERAVYYGLMAYWNRYQTWPTSLELLEFLLALKARQPRHPRYRLVHDVNSVRPRLTCLNQYDPPLVVTGPTRCCTSTAARSSTGRRRSLQVLTWRIPQLGEVPR